MVRIFDIVHDLIVNASLVMRESVSPRSARGIFHL
jgi:hypothetical protein